MIAITHKRVEAALGYIDKKIEIFAKKIESELADLNESAKNYKNGKSNKLPSCFCNEAGQLDKQIKFIDDILRFEVKKIIKAKPDEIKTWSKGPLNSIGLCKAFNKKILEVFRYKDQRGNKYFKSYFKRLGIKACVYCNAQSTIIASTQTGGLNARFECDHVLNKDDYPVFSMSFYNLYPSCSTCNRIKQKDKIAFDLYVENEVDIHPDRFLFSLDEASHSLYLAEKDQNELVVLFKDCYDIQGEIDKKFHLTGTYMQHIDIAEELIRKKKVYTPKYMDILNEEFFKLFPDEKDFRDRLIIGNYSRPEEIHKRPLSKFSQDIARQIGLLNPSEKKK